MMNFDLKPLSLQSVLNHKTDLLVIARKSLTGKKTPAQSGATSALSQYLDELEKEESFEPKAGKNLLVLKPQFVQAKRMLLLGVGDASLSQLRKSVHAAFKSIKSSGYKQVTLMLEDSFLQASSHPTSNRPNSSTSADKERFTVYDYSDQVLKVAVQAVADALYLYTKTKPSALVGMDSGASSLKTKSKPNANNEDASLAVTFACSQAKRASTQSAFAEACALSEGIELAKEWGNRPANHATPTHLAGVAESLGKHSSIKVQVMGPKEVEKLGMGSFMSVAQGSRQPLRFITMEYRGSRVKDKGGASAPTVLVGKGITFDTGGISLKPGGGMDEMKFDMCGAASVLGVFKTLAVLKPDDLHVVGLIPSCENMPDGLAVKPGDVVTSMSGQTIEILNTDAEGRLILCDALTYAARYKPKAVIDIATLTGACVIALGHLRSGLFSNNDVLAKALERSGETSMDTCWRMPLDEEYAEALKSNFADVANVGDRSAGSVTAAKFLQRFANDFAWAHLDIAGTAWKSGGEAKGATGRPVGLLIEYLLHESNQLRFETQTTAKKSAQTRKSKLTKKKSSIQ